MAEAVVVGAGQSGLAAARRLAEEGVATTVVERLPAPGGQEPEGAPERRLARAAEARGVRMLLGTLALRWTGGEVWTLGVGGFETVRAGVLVVASGSRPATRGELGIAGDRCAGILPGSAALHLVEAGVLLGHRPLVYGGGGLAASCAERLVEAGARAVTVVSRDEPTAALPAAAELIQGWRLTSVHGVGRVSAAWIERDGLSERVATDAVVLAEARVPMENVEGAIFQGPEQGVVPCHSTADPKRVEDAEGVAAGAVSVALERLGVTAQHEHEEV
jgi:NADPH-dependent 2,4-dienoyl-CoA reductase/sulfur reductase-like enzyme